MHSIMK